MTDRVLKTFGATFLSTLLTVTIIFAAVKVHAEVNANACSTLFDLGNSITELSLLPVRTEARLTVLGRTPFPLLSS